MKGKYCLPDPGARRATLAYTDDMNESFRRAWGTELTDILPGIAMALFMGACIRPLAGLGLGDAPTLALQFVSGALVYIGGSALLRLEAFRYLLSAVKTFRGGE